MNKIKFIQTITAYPDGVLPRDFAEGSEVVVGPDFPAEYADLMVAKGHAVEVEAARAPEPAPITDQNEDHA